MRTSEKTCTICATSGKDVAQSRRSYYSTGRDFYDDQYQSDSDDSSLAESLDFSQPLASLRQAELQRMCEAYERVWKQQETAVCLVQGVSGTGKSTVVSLFCDQVSSKSSSSCTTTPYILKGKFEETRSGPLSAILQAFGGLVTTLLLQNDPIESNRIQERILTNVGGARAAARLGAMLPCLQPLLGIAAAPPTAESDGGHCQQGSTGDASSAADSVFDSECNDMEQSRIRDHANASNRLIYTGGASAAAATLFDSECDMEQSRIRDHDNASLRLKCTGDASSSSDSVFDSECDDTEQSRIRDHANASNRLKYMFQALVKAICSGERPVILFLDDLQWCDASSLQLIHALLVDKELANFFFVGTYRIEERDRNSNNTGSLHNEHWESIRNVHPTMETIPIDNLTIDGLRQFLKAVLHLGDDDGEQDRIEEFAKALLQATCGNIFFARQVLEELHAKKALTFSRVTFMWEWDISSIDALDNVVEAVTQRILSTSSSVLRVMLTTAAYMKTSFNADSLKLMLALDGRILSDREMLPELDKAVTDGFLVSEEGSRIYSFAHDRIQEAAYGMIPEGQRRDQFRYNVGSRLYKMSKDPRLGKDWMVLSAADHLNATYTKDAIFLAKLNLEAGKKCLSVAAFESASSYLTFGLKNISTMPSPWDNHYALTLELYETRAEVELVRGKWQLGTQMVETVLENAQSIDDKLPTQLAYAKGLGRKKSHKESSASGRSTLQSMGLFPKRSMGVVVNLIRDLLYLRRYFKTHSEEEVLALPPCDDARLSHALELFENSVYQSVFCGNVLDFLACTLKSVRMTLKHGLFSRSGVAMMMYFMICDSTGDIQGARRFADLGLKMVLQSVDQSCYSMVLYLKTVCLDCWMKTSKDIVDLYNVSYKCAMEIGDFESAIITRCSSLDHEFLAGRPLVLLDIRFADLIAKEEMYAESLKKITMEQWLPTRLLRGTTDFPLDFDRLTDFKEEDTDRLFRIAASGSRLQIAVYWGNDQFFERILPKAVPPQDKSYTGMVPRLFFMAIGCNNLFRKKRKRKYRKKAEKAAAELKKWSEIKGMNSWHRCVILAAHNYSCSQRKYPLSFVLQQYDRGIEAAVRSQHTNDAGLAAQLAVEYIIFVDPSDQSKTFERYFRIAISYYREWGATALIRHLEAKYADNLGQPEAFMSRTNRTTACTIKF